MSDLTAKKEEAIAHIREILASATPANSAAPTAELKNLDILTGELASFASRMKYLAMAAKNIADGSTPAGIDRENCVTYLLDTLEYLGDVIEGAAENIDSTVKRALAC